MADRALLPAAAASADIRSVAGPTARLVVALLVTLQLAGPVAGVLAEPAPAGAAHHDHVGGPESPGCQSFHDELLCLSCRVIMVRPVRDAVALPSAATGEVVVGQEAEARLAGEVDPSPHGARAPPRV